VLLWFGVCGGVPPISFHPCKEVTVGSEENERLIVGQRRMRNQRVEKERIYETGAEGEGGTSRREERQSKSILLRERKHRRTINLGGGNLLEMDPGKKGGGET